MKKIWLKRKFLKRSLREKDEVKDVKIRRKLWKLSSVRRNRELKEAKRFKPLKRGSESSPSSVAIPANKTSLKLNVSGNLRGMHNYHNPPDSEQMRLIRAKRRFYNKQMPVLQCNNCAFSQNCPQYKAGYECAFLPFLSSHRVETEKDLFEYMKELIGSNMRRAHLATLQETLAGGKANFETTEALNLAFQQLTKLHEIMTEGAQGSISLESDDSGVIGKIFGSMESLMGATRDAHANPIEVIPLQLENGIDKEAEFGDKTLVNEDLVREHSRSELEHASGQHVEMKRKPEVPVLRKD